MLVSTDCRDSYDNGEYKLGKLLISKTVKLIHVSSPSTALEIAITKWLGDYIYGSCHYFDNIFTK